MVWYGIVKRFTWKDKVKVWADEHKKYEQGCEQGVFACLVMIILENFNCQRRREPLNGAVKSYKKYLFKFENLYILNVL